MEYSATNRSWGHPAQKFLVDLDHRGDWCVWQRLADGGSTAIKSCTSHNDAVNQAASFNAAARPRQSRQEQATFDLMKTLNAQSQHPTPASALARFPKGF